MRRDIHGILLLDKPLGVSSNGVLQRVKRLFQAKKAGHTGSLDPLATGMLPICFGEATKFSQFLLDADKSYYVVAKLGERTTTGDKEGDVIETRPVGVIDVARMAEVMNTFLGEIEQTPPMFSALKVNGRPLYELARQGIEIARRSRRITIFSLALEDVAGEVFSFRVHCSKGTYVRTLVEDIGNVLGCGAHVTTLRRESVSPYGQAKQFTWSELELMSKEQENNILVSLLPVESAITHLPSMQFTSDQVLDLRNGKTIQLPIPSASSWIRLLTMEGEFFGIGEVTPEGCLKPKRLRAFNHQA